MTTRVRRYARLAALWAMLTAACSVVLTIALVIGVILMFAVIGWVGI